MGRSQRLKGAVFERVVAKDLREATGIPFQRGVQTRQGYEAPDVHAPGHPWWFETKCGKAPPMHAALLQAEEAIEKCTDPHKPVKPVAVVKFHCQTPMAILRWPEFLEVLTDALAWRNRDVT